MGNKQPSSIYLSFTFKSFSGDSLHDVILFLKKNTKQQKPEVVLSFLAKQLRHKLLEKLRHNECSSKYCMALFAPWVDYPLDPYSPYLSMWYEILGRELTWFPPLKKVIQMIDTCLPSLKKADMFECLVPFAGSGIASYVFHHSFGIVTQSSDKKEDPLWNWLKSYHLTFVKKDAWRWVRHLSFEKKLVLLISYPPFVEEGDPNITDLLFLREVCSKAFVYAVIYVGREMNGSLGFHTELHQKFFLKKQEEIRHGELLKIYINPQVLVDEAPKSLEIPGSRRGSQSPLVSGLVFESEEIPVQQKKEDLPTNYVYPTKLTNDKVLLPLTERRSSHPEVDSSHP